MNRLTITLSEGRYKPLKEASARRGQTIGQLIDQSLEFYGIKTRDDAVKLVQRARSRAKLDAAAATRGWRSPKPALPAAADARRHQPYLIVAPADFCASNHKVWSDTHAITYPCAS